VLSVAQIGNALRVLVNPAHGDAVDAVRGVIEGEGIAIARCERAPASLEDVFVAATLRRAEAA
jgi:hypothetical protein